jgi:hypothetical protein
MVLPLGTVCYTTGADPNLRLWISTNGMVGSFELEWVFLVTRLINRGQG